MFVHNTLDSLSKTATSPISKAVLYHILKGFLTKKDTTITQVVLFVNSTIVQLTIKLFVLNFTPKDRTAHEHAQKIRTCITLFTTAS